MVEVEINGFDESGNIGENLIFVRACLNEKLLLRPYIYNILHFNILSLSKFRLKGQTPNKKQRYFRMLLDDSSIDIEFYNFSPEIQLQAMRKFVALEFKKIYGLRGQLVNGLIDGRKLKSNASNVTESMLHYMKPDRYIEIFIKAYGHKQVIESLPDSSKLLKSTDKNRKVISVVDGGYPFVFWANSFLAQAMLDGKGYFSSKDTPILGMTKADEYFPVTNIAGNIASIANTSPGIIFPHSITKLSPMSNSDFVNFHNKYITTFESKKSLPKVLFVGKFPIDLRYSIPLILYVKSGKRQIFEPFCINKSLFSFKKEYGVNYNDTIIMGKIESKSKDAGIVAEANDRRITIITSEDFLDPFEGLANDISNESKYSTLTSDQCRIIDNRLTKITRNVKKQLK